MLSNVTLNELFGGIKGPMQVLDAGLNVTRFSNVLVGQQ